MSGEYDKIDDIRTALLTLLQADATLSAKINKFLTEDGGTIGINQYPACETIHMATAKASSKKPNYRDTAASKHRCYTFIIRFYTNISDPEESKKQLQELSECVDDIVSKNYRLNGTCLAEWTDTKYGVRLNAKGDPFQRIADAFVDCFAMIPRN